MTIAIQTIANRTMTVVKTPGSWNCGKEDEAKLRKGRVIRYEKKEMDWPEASLSEAVEKVVVDVVVSSCNALFCPWGCPLCVVMDLSRG